MHFTGDSDMWGLYRDEQLNSLHTCYIDSEAPATLCMIS